MGDIAMESTGSKGPEFDQLVIGRLYFSRHVPNRHVPNIDPTNGSGRFSRRDISIGQVS